MLSLNDSARNEHLVHGTILTVCFQKSKVILHLGFFCSKWTTETLQKGVILLKTNI